MAVNPSLADDTFLFIHEIYVNNIFSNAVEIKIPIFSFSYKANGQRLDHFPGTIPELEKIEVDYITLPGWNTCTEDIREFKELPQNAQDYVKFVENELGIAVRWVGVGKGRESIINVH